MALNASVAFDLPPLPTYTLTAREHLLAPLPDNILSLILPVVAYWGLSMIYHFLDVNDYFVEYRLHTPAEVLKRNKVTRWEVVRDVVLQQVIQTVAGFAFVYFDAEETVGREEYDVGAAIANRPKGRSIIISSCWSRRYQSWKVRIPKRLYHVGRSSSWWIIPRCDPVHIPRQRSQGRSARVRELGTCSCRFHILVLCTDPPVHPGDFHCGYLAVLPPPRYASEPVALWYV